MEPTLHCAEPEVGCQASSSDRVLANRFIYRFRDPERGDIVVFETPQRAAGAAARGGTFVKRLIGLPGERIAVSDGVVLIDGRPIEEPYVNGGRTGRDFGERTLGDDEYFMMGDNRGQSCDSREWGPVERDDLIGPVFAVYWPLDAPRPPIESPGGRLLPEQARIPSRPLADGPRLGGDDRGRRRRSARDQDLGREPLPDSVVVDGADPALRGARARLRGLHVRPRAREPVRLSLHRSRTRRHRRLRDAARSVGSSARAPAACSSSA